MSGVVRHTFCLKCFVPIAAFLTMELRISCHLEALMRVQLVVKFSLPDLIPMAMNIPNGIYVAHRDFARS